jgi:hypothetical protein
MIIPIEQEFKSICIDIASKHLSVKEWSEIESSDMFQSVSFVGGFDADELEFCFSYFDAFNSEFWFQLSLNQIKEISNGTHINLAGHKPS